MSSRDINVGDTLRVMFESVVLDIEDDGTIHLADEASGDNFYFHHDDANFVDAEVVKRAVVTFKPGDRLRRKDWSPLGYEITLADDGYLQHLSNGAVGYHGYGTSRSFFTSENFDLVTLCEPPL